MHLPNCAVTGFLKGYDQLMNLVLDNVKEITKGKATPLYPSPLHRMPSARSTNIAVPRL